MAVVADVMIDDGKMEDTDLLLRCGSLWFELIVDITFNTLLVVDVSTNNKSLCNGIVASVIDDRFDCTVNTVAFATAYSYFRTDVGFIGIDKFVLCLFSMIGVVSLATESMGKCSLLLSIVAFVRPKWSDCCLKIR